MLSLGSIIEIRPLSFAICHERNNHSVTNTIAIVFEVDFVFLFQLFIENATRRNRRG